MYLVQHPKGDIFQSKQNLKGWCEGKGMEMQRNKVGGGSSTAPPAHRDTLGSVKQTSRCLYTQIKSHT